VPVLLKSVKLVNGQNAGGRRRGFDTPRKFSARARDTVTVITKVSCYFKLKTSLIS